MSVLDGTTAVMNDIATLSNAPATGLNADQAYSLWKGTPYESQLMKYITYQPGNYMGDGYEQEPGGYVWNADGWWDQKAGISNSQNAFNEYVRQQQNLQAMQAKAPAVTTLIDPSKYGTASDMAAAVTQAQYDNWKSTYLPAMLAARDMTTYATPGIVATEVQKGVDIAGKTAANALGQQQRSFARFGLSPNAAQQQSIDRSAALNTTAAQVDAANRIKSGLYDRNRTIMAGSVTNFSARI